VNHLTFHMAAFGELQPVSEFLPNVRFQAASRRSGRMSLPGISGRSSTCIQ
jgi:hypothetical protein